MQRSKKLKLMAAAATLAAGAGFWALPGAPNRNNSGRTDAPSSGAGDLMVVDKTGQPAGLCPLKHTDVQAEISGPLARVRVVQEFENKSAEKIEAVYVFPLPNRAAVDDMTMHIGSRVVKGVIKRREEAREIYERARQQGNVAALLDQERPNIFTQAVTNIEPGAAVKIEISYVEAVKYDGGSYEFSFPMVVGPRYIPGNAKGQAGTGWAPDTDRVPDASRITPHVAPKGVRAGHDISLSVKLDAGVAIESLASKSHAIDTQRPDSHRAVVRLRNQNEIPNKDFILAYDVAGRAVQDAVLTHRGRQGGFFTLLLQPPERVTEAEVTPKELVFVIDTSGSMSGFPIDKSKEVIKLALDGLHPRDTFNLITFAGDTHVLFPQPVPATPENVQRAQQFLLSRQGGGGTEMMKAIRAALDPSDQQDHVRIVCFLTDGYVGNDMEIVGEIRKHPNARIFSFGIGSSVNRFLLDKMAEEGRGEVEYVSLNDDGSAAAKRFHERVRSPLLTDLAVEWNGLPVTDVYPRRQPDLFAAKPVVIAGRYDRAATGTLRLRGRRAGRDWSREIPVNLPADQPGHDVLATLWAREKIEDLMAEDWGGMQHGQPRGDLKEAIVKVGLEFRLMTQFTSFVAVEETIVTRGGVPTKVEVPVEMPHGVSHEGVFGASGEMKAQVAGSFALNFGVVAGRTAQPMTAAMPAVAPPPPPRMARDERRIDAARPNTLPEPAKLRPDTRKVDARLLSAAPGTRVQVKVWLTDDSAAVIDQLRKLGLDIGRQLPGKIVLGRIDAGKLAALAAMQAVLYVSEDLGQL